MRVCPGVHGLQVLAQGGPGAWRGVGRDSRELTEDE